MRFKTVALSIALLLLVAGGMTIYAWISRPQLVEVSPLAGAKNVSAAAPIRLTFSRSMEQESVKDKFRIEPAIGGVISWDQDSLIFTPYQPWPSGQVISIQLEAGVSATSWLAFRMGANTWSFTTSGYALAYLWPATGAADIYALDPVTGATRQYTRRMNVLDFSASSDGRYFYFSTANTQGGADLYRIDRMKTESPTDSSSLPERLLDCGIAQCRNPVVSPDGRLLAYEYLLPSPKGGGSPAQIWMFDLATLAAKPVGQTGHETIQPAWSKANRLAYYDRTSGGYEVYTPESKEKVLLPNATGQPGTWSPDGAYYLAPEITYLQASGGNETGNSHLLRYRIQDGTSDDISGESLVEDVEAVYAPDSSSIAFTRKYLDAERWTPGRQIWTMRSDGSNPIQITQEPEYDHYDLAWSPDGLELAYARFNQEKISDPPELWMVKMDGSNPVQLVIGGYSPTWIP